jgi:hypothetical protein
VPKHVDTLTKFLTYLGTNSVKQGPGEQKQEVTVNMSRRHRMSLVLDRRDDGVCHVVRMVVIHAIQNEAESGCRMGAVTLYMKDGHRIKCGWSENSDGTVEVDTNC